MSVVLMLFSMPFFWFASFTAESLINCSGFERWRVFCVCVNLAVGLSTMLAGAWLSVHP